MSNAALRELRIVKFPSYATVSIVDNNEREVGLDFVPNETVRENETIDAMRVEIFLRLVAVLLQVGIQSKFLCFHSREQL